MGKMIIVKDVLGMYFKIKCLCYFSQLLYESKNRKASTVRSAHQDQTGILFHTFRTTLIAYLDVPFSPNST